MNHIFVLILSFLCGQIYRYGGDGLHNTKTRDVWCAVINGVSLYILGLNGHWWAWLISLIACFGAYTTYHKWLNKFFGDTREDVHWYGWLMHGFCIGLSWIAFGHNIGFVLYRALFLGIFTMIWSESISNARIEEYGRGFLSNITTLMLIT